MSAFSPGARIHASLLKEHFACFMRLIGVGRADLSRSSPAGSIVCSKPSAEGMTGARHDMHELSMS